MTRSSTLRRLVLSAAACAFSLNGGAALAKTTDYVDLEAGFGFSTNPLLQLDGQSSAFGRLSAYGVHSWSSERSTTTLSGYVENTSYLKDYGSKQIFNLDAQTSRTLSPTVTVFGDLGFSGDFAGQLSNRLISVPSGPVVPDPGNPLPPVNTVPDIFGFSGRQYTLNGSLGASIRTGNTGTISLSGGAQRIWFTGGNGVQDADRTRYFGTGAYSMQLSERTSGGVSLSLEHQDFAHGDWANIINPALTASTQLSETIKATGAVGVLILQQHVDGQSEHSVTPSFSGSVCGSQSEVSRWCARISRDAQSTLGAQVANSSGQAAITTIASLEYYRRLSANGTLQASLSATRYSTPANFSADKFTTTYLSAVVGYDRKIGHRLYAGISGGARKLFQNGPDPNTDFNASVYVRYRLGDLL